jgi:ssDNA-binding Zn-finger/Zn-ribbon topoisomerase 1
MIELADILREYGKVYIEQYKDKIPQNHLKVINDILICRRKENGGKVYYCDHCNKYIYSYHSCGNRNCNKCQNELADIWLKKTKERLLDVNHFLVTFTLPEALREFSLSYQNLFYGILFKSAAKSLQKITYDTKYIGGKLGMIAVLHTWARNLAYHTHVHFVVSAGGLFDEENIWLPSKVDFLVPVKALSKIFRAIFRELLKKEDEALGKLIPLNVWKKDWVVHSEPVGSGEQALSYLARYIFRPAISNNNILSLKNGIVTFRFKNNKTKQWQIMKLKAIEFIHRYLQHVLPKGFVKVRYYGLYAHARKNKLTKIPLKRFSAETDQVHLKKHCCPKCHNPLVLKETFAKMHFYANGPPKREVLLKAIYKKLNNPDF